MSDIHAIGGETVDEAVANSKNTVGECKRSGCTGTFRVAKASSNATNKTSG